MITQILLFSTLILGLGFVWAVRRMMSQGNNYSKQIAEDLNTIGNLQKRNLDLKSALDILLEKVALTEEKREMIKNETYDDISDVHRELDKL